MNALNIQIKALYEQGVPLDTILENFPNLSKDAVETMLLATSRKFRKESEGKDELYTKDMVQRLRDLSLELAEDPDVSANTRLKAIHFAMNEYKGRHDTAKAVQGAFGNVNVNVINMHFDRAKSQLENARNKVIVLEPAERELLEKV
jgi:hypothetical protein